jgi:glutathione S-transferase
MSSSYRIFGAELSPYSVKVRSYFRYKQIPHQWIVRHGGNMDEFERYAKLPLIPLVVTPDDRGMQDSTPIIDEMERRFPDRAVHPSDPALAFLSALIEEYADEWGNKWMFHYRWTYEPDQESAARRIAEISLPDASQEQIGEAARGIRQRMIPRLRFVGSSDTTRDRIEGSFRSALALVEDHLGGRTYLFGARPALADFGFYAQLHQCSTDPTPAARMRDSAPRTLAWIERMLDPKAEGEFESWDTLAPTLEPLLERDVGAFFLPWSAANARALAEGRPEFSVELGGRAFQQQTQKYHAKSLGALKRRYAALPDRSELDPILERTGCLRWLRDA